MNNAGPVYMEFQPLSMVFVQGAVASMSSTRTLWEKPTQQFLVAYEELWKDSVHPSAFQAPHYIEFLMGQADGPVHILACYRDGLLIGAGFLLQRGQKLQFLSDLKTDHNFFIFRKEAADHEMASFFRELFTRARREKWTLRLNNLPSWTIYRPIMLGVLWESGLFHREVRYNGCLTIETKTPQELFKTCDKKKLRQKMHRLEEMGRLELEVHRDDKNLEAWMEGYYNMHVRRWDGTSTPSNLRSAERRKFFTECARNWCRDGILVRFALTLDGKPISYLIALLEDGALVHHATTYDLDLTKQSPGLLMIRAVAQWVAEQGMCMMEFGDGDEAYKYLFTQHERPMHRLFISGPKNVPFRMKAYSVHALWDNRNVHNFYVHKVRPFLLRSKALRRRIAS